MTIHCLNRSIMLCHFLIALVTVLTCSIRAHAESSGKYSLITCYEHACAIELQVLDRLRNSNLSELRPAEKQLVLRYFDDFEDANGNLEGFDPGKTLENKIRIISGNPITKFRLMYRMYKEYRQIFKLSMLNTVDFSGICTCENFTVTFAQELKANLFWKVCRDKFHLGIQDHLLPDMSLAILYLCHIYNLNPSEFADGIIAGIQTGTSLRAKHCVEIANTALDTSMFTLAIEFLEAACEKAKQDESLAASAVENQLNIAIAKHDDALGAKDLSLGQRSFLFNTKIGPIRQRFPDKYKSFRVSQKRLFQPSEVELDSRLIHWDLCKRSKEHSAYNGEKFSCWLDTSTGPYWNLLPLKVEQYSKAPLVFQIYDILSPATMDIIREFTDAPRQTAIMRMSLPFTQFSDEMMENHLNRVFYLTKNVSIPIYHQTWPFTSRILQLFDDLEEFWSSDKRCAFNVYNAGDYTSPHYDNRITILYILEDAEQGGATTFLHGKVAVKGVPGAAVVLYNPKSFKGQEVGIHASCPVILGRKLNLATWYTDLELKDAEKPTEYYRNKIIQKRRAYSPFLERNSNH